MSNEIRTITPIQLSKKERQQKFNQPISEQYYSDSIETNAIKSLQYDTILFQLSLVSGFRSLLDMGSQRGQFAKLVQNRFQLTDITCVDVSEHSIAAGRDQHPDFCWILDDLTNCWLGRRFDLVTCLNTWYYIEQHEIVPTLLNIHNMLNQGGYFLIALGDSNLKRRDNISMEDLIDEVKQVFDLVNVLKSYEELPLYEVDRNFHIGSGKWYTTILFRR